MDGIIDIIIAVLFIAIPAIFKAIGNRLEKAGSDKAGKFKRIAEAMTSDEVNVLDEETVDEDNEIRDIFMNPVGQQPAVTFDAMAPEVPESGAVAENPVSQIHVPHRPEHTVPTNRRPMLLEEENEKQGERIDPKKLVIYSEIMKPKY